MYLHLPRPASTVAVQNATTGGTRLETAEEKQSCLCCLVLFFLSGCFGSKQYKDEGWSHDYSTALLVNVFTVCCSFYHYYFLQHYYYDIYHDGYTECTTCMCACVCQCSAFSAQSWSSQRRSWEESIAWGLCWSLGSLHPVRTPRLPLFQRSPWSH